MHVDMDAFYASVEQRDNPELRGKPVVVAWRGQRSVVCAASYEARTFGIHSAMPASRAERLCPQAQFVPPDFPRYRAVSKLVREIFARYTDAIEPLSLDEAYLDVTTNKRDLPTATLVAKHLRADIKQATDLNASAGVAPNKFLAKIASDWRKPNGLFVIQPHEVEDFLTPLEVRKLPGVGKATAAKLAQLNIKTVADLRKHPREVLEIRFGKFGRRLYNLARGIDHNPVRAHQERKSLSSETTFADDRLLAELETPLNELGEKIWQQMASIEREPCTVFIKLKTSDFRIITRSLTPPHPPQSLEAILAAVRSLTEKVDLQPHTRYRLAGVGLSNFRDPQTVEIQPALF